MEIQLIFPGVDVASGITPVYPRMFFLEFKQKRCIAKI